MGKGHMMQPTLRRGTRPLRIAALLTAGLIVGPPLAPRAHAIIGGCAGDPIVVLSNGVIIDLSASSDADASAVRHIAYTIHAPQGTWTVAVISLGVTETVALAADNAPDTYSTVTRVDASTSDATVTTLATMVPLVGVPKTGSATGATNEDLRIELGE